MNWKRPDLIFKYAKVAFVTRPGYEFEIYDEFDGKAVFLEFSGIDVSSTKIRKRIKNGKDVSEYISDKVQAYIKCNFLYKYDHIKAQLKTYINPKRYEHSLNVAYEAVKLADIYSISKEKAYIAGLLHDCAKDIDFKKQLKLINEYSEFSPMQNELSFPKVLHALTGTIIAKRDFNILDNEILSAIRYHTLGSTKMTPLDKIIYIADMIEPGRNYNGIEILRKIAYNNINQAMIQSIENTIAYIGEENVQKETIALKNYLKEKIYERI